MGACYEERNTNKNNKNMDAAMPVISTAPPENYEQNSQNNNIEEPELNSSKTNNIDLEQPIIPEINSCQEISKINSAFTPKQDEAKINISEQNINIDQEAPNVINFNEDKNSILYPKFSEIETPEIKTASLPKENIIKMKFKINKDDVNKATKLLYNINEKIEGCDIKELNENNTELYINNEKHKYKSFFIPEKEGIYNIKLKIKILMKNCCCLFYGLNHVQNIDLSPFNTENVTNMSYMFYFCYNL